MLSTAKSANIGLQPVAQLFAPPTNPAAPAGENSFYKSAKTFLWVSCVAPICIKEMYL